MSQYPYSFTIVKNKDIRIFDFDILSVVLLTNIAAWKLSIV
ncbi:MAG: hypothetical protein UY70_C0012G0012 [Candidatus Kaiserbacteria bacterium GW2011_GWB1_52_6]|uniref:Uncharacterized protein n=2 Tax=Candidatus Kaiseribacteriota TaxID=1752734 RepID=A0A0G1X9L2_9BACT|nr:MAG: hypothetical protein UY67_C0010G0015 [Candidatus Kaiserbacteria bacterium GW2011_GWA2_52_12]KKW27540.1 MAG: hypothetical protein UY70_C0012G0012 [Candidatus Kaiserbacteria bacterium GW2011_GWB1_52_6]